MRRVAFLLLVTSLGAALVGCAGMSRKNDVPPEYLRPVGEVKVTHGTLGFGSVRLGMTRTQLEELKGEKLVLSNDTETDFGCGGYTVGVVSKAQKLHVEFRSRGPDGHVRSVSIFLKNKKEPLDSAEIARVLKANIPDLEFLPSEQEPDVTEDDAKQRLYRFQHGPYIYINPDYGISFGYLCLD